MAKFVVILVAAAIIESIGVALLSWGLKDVQGVREITVSEIVRVAKSGVTNVKIIGGVALEALFFGALLYMMSTRDVSFVWPLTSLGFIFTTLAAQFILHERVSAARWVGVLLIAFGAGLTGYSEAAKEQSTPPPGNSAPLGPQ
jgi:drug/metabolite transporter (DMT)-like permease